MNCAACNRAMQLIYDKHVFGYCPGCGNVTLIPFGRAQVIVGVVWGFAWRAALIGIGLWLLLGGAR